MRSLRIHHTHSPHHHFVKYLFLFIYLFGCARSRCGMWALSCSMWGRIPWPGIEPGSPALGAMRSRPCSLQLEKAHRQQWRPSTAKKKKKVNLIKKKKKVTCPRSRVARHPLLVLCHTTWVDCHAHGHDLSTCLFQRTFICNSGVEPLWARSPCDCPGCWDSEGWVGSYLEHQAMLLAEGLHFRVGGAL